MQDKVISDHKSPPAEAQKQAAEFIAFLRRRYGVPQPQAIDFDRDPFIRNVARPRRDGGLPRLGARVAPVGMVMEAKGGTLGDSSR
jgi:hypothetical protein